MIYVHGDADDTHSLYRVCGIYLPSIYILQATTHLDPQRLVTSHVPSRALPRSSTISTSREVHSVSTAYVRHRMCKVEIGQGNWVQRSSDLLCAPRKCQGSLRQRVEGIHSPLHPSSVFFFIGSYAWPPQLYYVYTRERQSKESPRRVQLRLWGSRRSLAATKKQSDCSQDSDSAVYHKCI